MSTMIPRPAGRLDSLKRPGGPLDANRPPALKRIKHLSQAGGSANAAGAARRPNCCRTPDVKDTENGRVCLSCGTMISESNIVSEVTFGETAAGAAVVQGAFVGEGQRHARSMGSAFRRVGGGMESREQTEYRGREELRKLAGALRLVQTVEDQAFQIWKLAATHNFIQGRRSRMVAAVCLYAACRRDRNNTVLLMDLAEKIHVNVFKLGEVYKDLVKELWLGDMGQMGVRPVIEVEPLVMKFARKLEFGDMTHQVATDAVKILKRMNRDWMVTGRQPAGLCGACIILAARMNNFRRSVREVVYVVKVADVTIQQRLTEFKRTKSSRLTVDQFRKIGHRLKDVHEPPAVYNRRERERRKKQLLAQLNNEEPIVISDEEGEEGETSAETQVQSQQQRTTEPRRDADGFVIPDIPIDPSLRSAGGTGQTDAPSGMAESSGNNTPAENDAEPQPTTATSKRKRGRPADPEKAKKRQKKKKQLYPPVSEDDLIAEEILEEEIENIINAPRFGDIDLSNFDTLEKRTKAMADAIRRRTRAAKRNGTTTSTIAAATTTDGNDADVDGDAADEPCNEPDRTLDETIIRSDEFDSDPEIAHVILAPDEVAVKERIWVTHNEDWLRQQQAKLLKKALAEAEAAASDKQPKQKKRRVRSRMGDGTVLEGGPPVTSPAEATRRMLEKRGKGFSKHINYDRLNQIYGGPINVPGSDKEASAGAPSNGSAANGSSARSSPASASPPAGATPPATNDAATTPAPASRRPRARLDMGVINAAAQGDGLPTPSATQEQASRPRQQRQARQRQAPQQEAPAPPPQENAIQEDELEAEEDEGEYGGAMDEMAEDEEVDEQAEAQRYGIDFGDGGAYFDAEYDDNESAGFGDIEEDEFTRGHY
ncbi:hypothetical protein BDY21DRAFT_378992 [Lineolata rhizophorae]|uniref:B-related factor 1 n=1 Tax=Lineolata rhizophorae TaxID=578093 RepID=A0A6A6P2A0_9PEZI|nr:hypothetical protein BDY21DRAFT_378992 [Lineolata rhizophorae]